MRTLSIEQAYKGWAQLLTSLAVDETLALTRAGAVIAYITPAHRSQHWEQAENSRDAELHLHVGMQGMTELLAPLD